jgi:hypothetical protein
MRNAVCLLALTSLTACASVTEVTSVATVIQNKYDHLDCEKLAQTMKTTQANIDKQQGLLDKASQEAGGGIIGSVAYGPVLQQAHGNMRVLKIAYAEKNCVSTETPAAPAAAPAQKKRR